MGDKKQIVMDKIDWVDDYIKNYCVIVHPDKNTEGKKPENVIREKLLSANSMITSLIDPTEAIEKLEKGRCGGLPKNIPEDQVKFLEGYMLGQNRMLDAAQKILKGESE